jgi:hypothetical protein
MDVIGVGDYSTATIFNKLVFFFNVSSLVSKTAKNHMLHVFN